jgi:hypothetical protein
VKRVKNVNAALGGGGNFLLITKTFFGGASNSFGLDAHVRRCAQPSYYHHLYVIETL